MQKRTFLKVILGATVVGIFCICVLGRPGPGQSAPFSWVYTSPPPTVPPGLDAQLMTAAAAAAAGASTPAPPLAPLPTDTPAPLETTGASLTLPPAITTLPSPFSASSVVGTPLKDAIATLAANMPGYTIRPYMQGTTMPPSAANPQRVNVGYDPNTLVVTAVTTG